MLTKTPKYSIVNNSEYLGFLMNIDEIGKDYHKTLTTRDKKVLGSHYTRFEDACKLVVELLSYVEGPITRVLEPSCGGGVFAAAVYHALKERGMDGLDIINNVLVCVDLDKKAANITKKVLLDLEPLAIPIVIVADTLMDIGKIVDRYGEFDAVVGNPPYVRIHNIENSAKEIYRKKFSTFKDKADLSIAFMEAGFDCLSEGGAMGYIISDSFARNKSGQYIRSKIGKHLASYDNRNSDGKFDASVSVTDIIVTKRVASKLFYNGKSINRSWLGENEWIFEKKDAVNGFTLEELNISLSLGIVTGCNEAFIGDYEECEWTRKLYRNKKKDTNQRLIYVPSDITKPPKWVSAALKDYKDGLVEKVTGRMRKAGKLTEDNPIFDKGEIKWWVLQGLATNIDWKKENWIIKRIGSTFDDFKKIQSGTVCLDTSYVLQTPKNINADVLVGILQTCPKIHKQLEQIMNKIGNKYEIHANKFKRIVIPKEYINKIKQDPDIFK